MVSSFAINEGSLVLSEEGKYSVTVKEPEVKETTVSLFNRLGLKKYFLFLGRLYCMF